MFENLFNGINLSVPTWSECYAYATLLRLMRYNDPNYIESWRLWSGANQSFVIPPADDYQSHVTVFNTGRSAIVAFEGTRNRTQLIQELLECTPVADTASGTFTLSFFKWALNQVHGTITDRLATIPGLERVIVIGHSMGGALGHLFAKRLKTQNVYPITALYTFGQPRTFVGFGPLGNDLPYFRIIEAHDPTPGLPPPRIAISISYPYAGGAMGPVEYRHTDVAWIVNDRGLVGHRDNLFTNEIFPQLPAWLLDPTSWEEVVQQNHIARIYVDRMRRLASAYVENDFYKRLHEINRGIDTYELSLPPQTGPLPGLPSPGTFAHPGTTYPSGVGAPTPPAGSVGTIVEQRRVAHSFFSFGGDDVMPKTFQSRDRRILQKLDKLLAVAVARDARVANPKKTSTLSNRILMFPPGGSPSMADIITAVQDQVTTLLTSTTS